MFLCGVCFFFWSFVSLAKTKNFFHTRLQTYKECLLKHFIPKKKWLKDNQKHCKNTVAGIFLEKQKRKKEMNGGKSLIKKKRKGLEGNKKSCFGFSRGGKKEIDVVHFNFVQHVSRYLRKNHSVFVDRT